MNDIGKVHGKKRLLFAGDAGCKVQRGLLLPAFLHVRIKGLVLGLWPKRSGNDGESRGNSACFAEQC